LGSINICNLNELTINELGELVLSITGTKSKLTYKDLPKDDPKQRCPNIQLVKKEFCWEPKVALEYGLKETISFVRFQLNN